MSKQNVLAMFLDYTNLPRAWGKAPDRETAVAIAREQLKLYCAKQMKLGEIDLADEERYTLRVEPCE